MSVLRLMEKNQQTSRYSFWCPGCDTMHWVSIAGPTPGSGVYWTLVGTVDKPTFQPSILVSWSSWDPPVTPENMEQWREKAWPQNKVDNKCHLFISQAQIQFLPDCTHKLAGKTVPMVELETLEERRDE